MPLARSLSLFIIGICSLVATRAQTPQHYYFQPANSGVNNLAFNSGVSQKFIFIYTRGEFAGMIAPVTGPVTIDTLFFRSNVATPVNILNLNIRLGHTSLAQPVANFNANFNQAPPATVLSANNYTLSSVAAPATPVSAGWTAIPVAPFRYNFTDNLAVEFSFDSTSFPLTLYTDNAGAPPLLFAANATATVADTTGPLSSFGRRMMFGISAQACQPQAFSLGADTSICQGQSLTLSPAIAGASYLWSDSTTSDSINVSQGGLYWVQVTVGTCQYRDSILVSVTSLPVVNLGEDTTLCQQEELVLDARQAGASYRWNDGSAMGTLRPVQSGIYWVDVTNNNCSSSDSIQVTFLPRPLVDLGADTSICEGDSLLLDVRQPGLTYLWQDGSMEGTFIARQAGLYSVQVRNAEGCIARDSIELQINPIPQVDLGADSNVCEGVVLVLNAGVSGASYRWQDGSTAPAFSTIEGGVFSVQVDLDGCIAEDSVLVRRVALPVFELGADTSICEGESLLLDPGIIGDIYEWQDGSAEGFFEVSEEGLYWVQVEREGCSFRDSLQVLIDFPPVLPTWTDTVLCLGERLRLDVTQPGASYLWQDNSVEGTFSVRESGTYAVTVTNKCGQRNSALVVSIEPCECKPLLCQRFHPKR
jgi:hypothetical protein